MKKLEEYFEKDSIPREEEKRTGYYRCQMCNFVTYNWNEFRNHIHKEHVQHFYKSIGLE